MATFLKIVLGAIVAAGGWLVAFADGWPPVLAALTLERQVFGGVLGALGVLVVLNALVEALRPAPKVRAPPAPLHERLPLDEPAPAATATAPRPEIPRTEVPVADVPAPFPADPDAGAVFAAEPEAPVAAPAPAPFQPEPAAEPDAQPAPVVGLDGDRFAAEGRHEEAVEAYGAAVEAARTELAQAPDDAAARTRLAAALMGRADAQEAQGRLDAAIEDYQEALELRRALARGAPGDLERQRALSVALERLADCRESRGHRSRALDLYRESLAIAQSLAAIDADNPVYREDLLAARRRTAELEARMSPA